MQPTTATNGNIRAAIRPSGLLYGSGAGTLFLALIFGALGVLVPVPGAAQASKGDRAFGEYLSGTCVTCHQITGKASGGIPPIIAWPEDQFIAVMNAYRARDRENLVMRTIAGPLSDEEIAALAVYFGSLSNQPQIK